MRPPFLPRCSAVIGIGDADEPLIIARRAADLYVLAVGCALMSLVAQIGPFCRADKSVRNA